MKEITTNFNMTVPFYDLDPMNIVWHGNYVKYIEEARCDFFKKLNYDYMAMYKDGIMYPIAKMDFKFIKSAYFGQEITIKTTLKELEPAIIFKYTLTDSSTGEKICTANTMQIAIDIKTKETILNAPQNLITRIEGYTND